MLKKRTSYFVWEINATMALFAVGRYMGDEDEDDERTEQAQDILQKLNQEAQERKKTKLQQSDNVEENLKSREKQKKKKKRQHSDGGEAEGDSDTERQNEMPKKIKLEKHSKEFKKSKENDTESEDVSDRLQQKENVKDVDNDDFAGSKTEPNDINLNDKEENNETGTLHKGQLHTEIGGFTVIGDVRKKRKDKVLRVLPEWLAQPSVVSEDIRNKRVELTDLEGLDEEILGALRKNGISYFFPVQAQVIPILLDGVRDGNLKGKAGYRPSDVCCSAPTGSGKTLAFVLPVVQALKNRVVCRVRALVVLPVRDLAVQVYNVFSSYCTGTDLKVGLIAGQKTLSNEQQTLVKRGFRRFQSQVDIIVATPGRLVDHINQTTGFDLSHLRYLVIDEADRIMDEIKQDWLTQVENAVFTRDRNMEQNAKDTTRAPFERSLPGPNTAANAAKMEMPLQKLLFSATLSQNPEKLQQLNLFQPKLFTSVVKGERRARRSESNVKIEDGHNTTNSNLLERDNADPDKNLVKGEFVGKFTTPMGLTEYFILADSRIKPLIVLHLLHQLKFKHILCFTNSLESTHRLYLLIKEYGGVTVGEFSSQLHPKRKAKILKSFSSGSISILICSDTMARGMDIENVQCVVCYESAPYLKTYIHRVGRTARAGKAGTAFSLLEKGEIFHFKKLMKEAGKDNVQQLKITRAELKPLNKKYEETLQKLPSVIRAEKISKKKQRR